MLVKDVTLESVLRDYYNAIPSENLSEDKIVIVEEAIIPNSAEMYVIRLAKFLNECYYKGYILSGSILKRLMDIIDYEGYEYQILNSYIDILNKSMNDYDLSSESKPDFDKLNLNVDNCRNFVTKYAEAISNGYKSIPHFKEPNIEEEEFVPATLKEIENPIHTIFEGILHRGWHVEGLVENLYVLYNTDPEFFYENIYSVPLTLRVPRATDALCFLLDDKDIKAMDVLTHFISSLDELKYMIKLYYEYMEEGYIQLSHTASKNIERMINILTINMPIQMVAFKIGMEYDFWKTLWSDTHCMSKVLSEALDIYTNDKDLHYKTILDNILSISDYDEHDRFFYARYFLLNMDYSIVCDNYIKIFTELYNNLEIGQCYELIDELIDGLTRLENDSVDTALINLEKELDEVTREEFIDPILKYTCDVIGSYREGMLP